MRIGNYLHWQDADQIAKNMLQSNEWENAWVEADRLNGVRVFTVYGIARNPKDSIFDPILINNAYDAY